MSDENVTRLDVSAAAVERMARAVETVDWEEMGRVAYEAFRGSGVPNMAMRGCGQAWQAAAKAVYEQAGKHIITAACKVPG